MCGVVGYVGKEQAAPILLDGLAKLEYRGYDSAGVAVFGDSIKVQKCEGRLKVLHKKIKGGSSMSGTMGIGHTRWATHGEPSDANSHPHTSAEENVAVVHNGIIENYLELKDFLKNHGCVFTSDTDTEVIAHLIDHYHDHDPLKTLIKVMNKLEGSYALGIMFSENPGELYAVRKDSPLIVGLSKGGNFIASDIPAVLPHTRDVYLLNDKEIVRLTADAVKIFNTDEEPIKKDVYHVEWDVSSAEKGGYEHFMFKEIMEQPKAVRETVRPRVKRGKIVPDEFQMSPEDVKNIDKIHIIACGSAYHAGVVGKYLIEKMARIPVEVDLASEFLYRSPMITNRTLMLVISQSGETLDTLRALREAKRLGGRVLSVVNVVGSSIARESDDIIYTWAGPEIAVATTKAYSTQLAVIYLLAEYFAVQKGIKNAEQTAAFLDELAKIPAKIEQIIKNTENIQFLASQFAAAKDVFFLGRGIDYAVALEGSLKLKEISYVHSEAYAAGELKHGTISLIEKGTPVVALATQDELFDKIMSNIREVKARGAVVLAVVPENQPTAEQFADHVLYVPKTIPELTPSLAVIPLQLFGYYMAAERGCDIDKPRNLAKSVTVE
ncbi:MAG: glutamine--fructose-6-phosphate transaminase (isomerizing) [Clostridiales bacterium]|jgi:glucosamine--fructose-6-phosphate aminotransferase (isomerizing)|nr:glutamine--fructose-6-phosphate transaminase (isomerizing) [Clostridiales bacterium]